MRRTPTARRQRWLGLETTWHHRTIEDYVTAILETGFTLANLRECPPDPTRFGDEPAELRRRRRIPLILLLSARADRAGAPDIDQT